MLPRLILYTVTMGLCLGVPWARADLPLTVENLLTEANRWRIEMGVTYAGSDQRNLDARFTTLQTGPGQFITLPAVVGTARQNRDTLILTPGLRYGLSLDTELYTRFSTIFDDTRIQNIGGNSHRFTKKFSDVQLGINHRFSYDDQTPACLGFIEIVLAENTAFSGNDWSYGRTGLVGFTTYRSTDPIVLALSGGYRFSLERNTPAGHIDPGDVLFINPSIAFAVNNLVTLTSGLQWQWQQQEVVNGIETGIRTTRSQIELGLGYAWSRQTSLQLNTRADVTGDSGIQVSLVWIYKVPVNPDKFIQHGKN